MVRFYLFRRRLLFETITIWGINPIEPDTVVYLL